MTGLSKIPSIGQRFTNLLTISEQCPISSSNAKSEKKRGKKSENYALLILVLVQKTIVLLDLLQQRVEYLRDVLPRLGRAFQVRYAPTVSEALSLLERNLALFRQILHAPDEDPGNIRRVAEGVEERLVDLYHVLEGRARRGGEDEGVTVNADAGIARYGGILILRTRVNPQGCDGGGEGGGGGWRQKFGRSEPGASAVARVGVKTAHSPYPPYR